MIRISKDERDWLVANGIKTGENGVCKTYSRYTHYYLTETEANLKALNRYRREHTR